MVPPGDPAALAEALERLIRSPELRRQLGDAGRRRVSEEFSIERVVAQLATQIRAAGARTMKIWLVVIGEPVPVGEGVHDRLHRGGYFATFLADHGHEVTWWTSTFDHMRKKHRFQEDATVEVNPRLQIRLLHGGGYRSNISLARLRDHRAIAGKFAHLAAAEADAPQIIVAALPTIGLCLESVQFGQRRGVPTVLDMRDMWPDIFVDTAPGAARPLLRLLLGGMFRQARQACAGARRSPASPRPSSTGA